MGDFYFYFSLSVFFTIKIIKMRPFKRKYIIIYCLLLAEKL